MEYLDDIFKLLPQEISNALRAISKTENLSEKKAYSEIVLNLSKSMSVFYEALDMAMPEFLDGLDEFGDYNDFDDLDSFEDITYQPTLMDAPKLKKSKKAKKKMN